MFGPKGGMKLIGHMKCFEDWSTGIQYPNQCIVKALMGVDNSFYLPHFSGEKSLDERAKREVQSAEVSLINLANELEESAKTARDENMIDEALDYEEQLKVVQRKLSDHQRPLKGDFITARQVRGLYEGEISVAFTHVVRQRKRRGVERLYKEGFEKEAEDLNRSFDTGNRTIVFLKDESAYKWILKPDEGACASRAP